MLTTTTASKAGPRSLWPSTLYSIILSTPCPINTAETPLNFNPRRRRHPPGMIWKRDLGKCLHDDFLEEEKTGSLIRQRRRFVRLESFGLSGVILYEIPTGRASADTGKITPGERLLTLKAVFGDPMDPDVHGMEIGELLDTLSARVIHFPSYACTSFISGQAISAFFQQQPRIRPVPAPGGFSVDATAFVDSSFTVGPSFALDSAVPCPSSSPFPPESTSSVPLIKIYLAECRRVQGLSRLIEPTLLMVRDYGSSNPSSCQGLCTDVDSFGGLGTNVKEDVLTEVFPEPKAECDKDNEAIESHYNNLLTAHPRTLSLVLDDYHEIFPNGVTQDSAQDKMEKDECNTSISTLGSAGPETPPRNSLVLSDTEDYLSDDKDQRNDSPRPKRQRPNIVPLTLRSARGPDSTTIYRELKLHQDIQSPSSSSSISFILESDSGLLSEPLTPIPLTNFGVLQDLDRTPTNMGASTIRPPASPKAKRRTFKGKENIAPTSMRARWR